MKKVKEYQTLIAGLTVALAVAGLVFRMGQAVEQHNHIITTQGRHQQQQQAIIQMIQDKCR